MPRPKQFRTAKEMQRHIDMYFDKVRFNAEEEDIDTVFPHFKDKYSASKADKARLEEVREKRPLVTGLALFLNLTRQGLINYEKRDLFVDTVKRAKTRVEMAIEESLYGGNAAGPIFNLKNNFQWVDEKTNVNVEKSHDEWVKELDDEADEKRTIQ